VYAAELPQAPQPTPELLPALLPVAPAPAKVAPLPPGALPVRPAPAPAGQPDPGAITKPGQPGADPTPPDSRIPAKLPQLAQQAEPAQPAQPSPAATPQQPAPTTPEPTAPTGGQRSVLSGLLGSVGGGGAAAVSASAPSQASSATAAPAANVVSGGDQALTRAATDAGDLLTKSQTTGVEVQYRSPIVTFPSVRGYYGGNLTVISNGAFFSPARYDLDTVVSKINSSNIDSVVVVKGPYSVRYGPGFAFLDIETLGTPRYDCFEAHGSSSVTYKTNGQQWRGLQSVWGGEQTWGFRLDYDIMEGADYFAGNGVQLPSRYSQQDIDFAYGFDFSPDSHVEFKALRLRQRNVELPGTLTDINALVTDAYTARYTLDNQVLFSKLTVDAWYNYTHFNGDNLRPSKRLQIPELNNFFTTIPNISLNLETQGDSISRGFREAMSWGDPKCGQVTLGVDFLYLSSYLDEFDTFVAAGSPIAIPFVSPIPRANMADPGLYIDGVLPVGDRLTLKAGARVDLATTQVERLRPPVTNAQYKSDLDSPNALSERHFDLWATYLTSELKLNDNVKFLSGCGVSERPPTLTELYADTPFLAVVQNGFNFMLGNPDLSAPQALQFDFGLKADYERYRGGINMFYAWIHNYITYELFDPGAQILANQGRPVPLQGLRYINTELASLAGGEFYSEYDALDWLTPFATLSYQEGRDLTRNGRDTTFFSLDPQFAFPTRGNPKGPAGYAEEPLPGINPIESRLGFRIHQASKSPRWAVEFTTRIVGNQNRVATSLNEVPIPGFTIYNLRSYWQVNKNFTVTAGVENFTNHNYRESVDLLTGRGVLQPGINFYFGAKMDY
jgi:outer membrane receptor protein involved in Fe transport